MSVFTTSMLSTLITLPLSTRRRTTSGSGTGRTDSPTIVRTHTGSVIGGTVALVRQNRRSHTINVLRTMPGVFPSTPSHFGT